MLLRSTLIFHFVLSSMEGCNTLMWKASLHNSFMNAVAANTSLGCRKAREEKGEGGESHPSSLCMPCVEKRQTTFYPSRLSHKGLIPRTPAWTMAWSPQHSRPVSSRWFTPLKLWGNLKANQLSVKTVLKPRCYLKPSALGSGLMSGTWETQDQIPAWTSH